MIRIVDTEAVPALIAGLRAEAKLSQMGLVEVADFGFTQQQLCRWETGKFLPSMVGLLRLAGALGYDLALVPREDA